jgi:hypothetical protein
MAWAFFILVVASGAAGVALGPVISRRSRLFLLIGGTEAALLGGALRWLPAQGIELPVEPGAARLLALALLAVAAVLLPFWSGSSWSGH